MPSKTQRQIQKILRMLKSSLTQPFTIKNLHVFYRLSDGSYEKSKPPYISNEKCLRNYVQQFGEERTYLIADNVQDSTWDHIQKCYPAIRCERTSFGNGAASFNHALDLALKLPANDGIYFLEDDYLHRNDSYNVLIEGLELGTDYVTLYDCPDTYDGEGTPRYLEETNPTVEGGGEITKVFLSKSCHWKLTNSATMTFASTVKVLRRDEVVLRKWTEKKHPQSFWMFMELREAGRALVNPLPGYATHGENKWLCPLVDWKSVSTL
ncbi:MAG: hypothetical protein P8M70_01075 [Verrucomicrobiota bacterium]|nr:hypothetical protein [Verrucomicrobiota bacterium]